MKILDLFCGAGGASMGYHRAFPHAEIVGVDINPQPRYPFTFVQADAMEVLSILAGGGLLAGRFNAGSFDLIHGSPPCQGYTTMSNRWRGKGGAADEWPQLIAPVRAHLRLLRLMSAGRVATVIENVDGARREMDGPVRLRGGMFDLGVDRPRLFECSFPVGVPGHRRVQNPIGVYGKSHDGRRLFTRADGSIQRAASSLKEGRDAMGIDWMEWRELAESIPPAYTEWIGRAFAGFLEREEAA